MCDLCIVSPAPCVYRLESGQWRSRFDSASRVLWCCSTCERLPLTRQVSGSAPRSLANSKASTFPTKAHCTAQCGPNPGPRAACGPRTSFVRPSDTSSFVDYFVSNTTWSVYIILKTILSEGWNFAAETDVQMVLRMREGMVSNKMYQAYQTTILDLSIITSFWLRS